MKRRKQMQVKVPPVEAPKQPVAVVKVVEVIGTPITEAEKKILYEEALAIFAGYVKDYNAEKMGVPDRLIGKAQSILGALTLEQAQASLKKAKDSGLICYLSAWASNKITGKITAYNVEVKAKSAEKMAEYLDSLGQNDAADRQRQKAEHLRSLVT